MLLAAQSESLGPAIAFGLIFILFFAWGAIESVRDNKQKRIRAEERADAAESLLDQRIEACKRLSEENDNLREQLMDMQCARRIEQEAYQKEVDDNCDALATMITHMRGVRQLAEQKASKADGQAGSGS